MNLLCENIDSWAKNEYFLQAGAEECLCDKGFVRMAAVNMGDLDKAEIS